MKNDMEKPKSKASGKVVALFSLLYFTSYILLSINGVYWSQSTHIGVNGDGDIDCVPLNNKWYLVRYDSPEKLVRLSQFALNLFFYPLLVVDRALWHDSGDAPLNPPK